MAECSISGEKLHAHRARGLKGSLRALGTALPIAIVALVHWREEYMVLVFITGVVSTAAAYSAWRWLMEIRLPADERFVLDGDVLKRLVGGVEKARIHHSNIKGVFRQGRAIVFRGDASIVIPLDSEGFASMKQGLSIWGDPDQMNATRRGVLAQVGARGVFFALLLTGTLVYLSYESGDWRWFVAGTFSGLLCAELLWRLALRRKKDAPIAF